MASQPPRVVGRNNRMVGYHGVSSRSRSHHQSTANGTATHTARRVIPARCAKAVSTRSGQKTSSTRSWHGSAGYTASGIGPACRRGLEANEGVSRSARPTARTFPEATSDSQPAESEFSWRKRKQPTRHATQRKCLRSPPSSSRHSTSFGNGSITNSSTGTVAPDSADSDLPSSGTLPTPWCDHSALSCSTYSHTKCRRWPSPHTTK